MIGSLNFRFDSIGALNFGQTPNEYTVPTSAFTLTANAPTWTSGRFSVPVSPLILNENEPTLRFAASIPETPLTLTSEAPTLVSTLTLPTAALTLSEQAPITSPQYASIQVTALSLTSEAPSLRYDVEVPVSSCALIESDPTIAGQVVVPNEAFLLIEHPADYQPLFSIVPTETLIFNEQLFFPQLHWPLPKAYLWSTALTPQYEQIDVNYVNATAVLTLPAPTLYAAGNDSDNARAALTLPEPTISAYTGAATRMTLPAPTLTAAATSPGFATVALEFPALELAATAITGEIGGVALTLPAPTLSASTGAYASLDLLAPQLTAAGSVTHLARVELTLPFLELTAVATVGAVATVTLELEDLLLSASGVVGNTGTVQLIVPAIVLTATGAGVITETTYAVNLNTGAVTNLLLGAFDKLVTAHGRLYGLRDGALVKLEGDADGATPIQATIRFAPQTFGTNQAKRMSNVYLSSREDDGVNLTLVADEINQWHYQTNTDTAPAYGTHKVKVGRGIKFHTAGLILKNRNGGRMDIGGMELLVDGLSPRPKT